MSRQDGLERIRQNPQVSVLIVGGGVNGAGVFRELALQGVDVLLVEKDDFASGTSSAPSRMIHGGLRYLENGEFRLVRESLRERNLLLENAPHYVKPLPTTIPIFDWFSGTFKAPGRFLGIQQAAGGRGALVIKLGLWMYDYFTRHHRILPTHRFHSRGASLRTRPLLNPRIAATATYYDAWISYPERLCLELIQDGSSPTAHALNYVALKGGNGSEVHLQDLLTGEQFDVQPRVVINAAGPWIDLVNQRLRLPTDFIGGTKGSHVILDHPELLAALNGEMLFYENADGRVCIMFPLLGKVLAGSTDIRVDSPDDAMTTEADIAYILESIRQVFPALQLRREDVVYHYCGVRPLPRQSVDSTGLISRDHSIQHIPPSEQAHFPIYALIGGKWTTFRAFAEQVADQVLPVLGRARQVSSAHLPIGGGRDYPTTSQAQAAWIARVKDQTGLPAERLQTLLHRYGSKAEAVAEFVCAAPDTPLHDHPTYSRREIAYLVQHETVCHLDDLVLRRTPLALLGEVSGPLLHELAEISAPLLGWPSAQAEVERTAELLAKNHGVHLLSVDLHSAHLPLPLNEKVS
jgi:glycerol-3-phosphate dehydrogenase